MDKSTRWQFTAYEGDYSILDAYAQTGHDLIAEIGWQDEICPKTQKKHRQGYVRTVRQVRFAQIKAIMGGVHLEKAKNWEALVNYCRKQETRDPSGNYVARVYERPLRLHEMLISVAEAYLIELDKNSSRIDRQTDRRVLLSTLRQYSVHLVLRHPEYATVLVRQDARDAWCDYVDTWLALAEARLYPQ